VEKAFELARGGILISAIKHFESTNPTIGVEHLRPARGPRAADYG
jgi:hypothetical protein